MPRKNSIFGGSSQLEDWLDSVSERLRNLDNEDQLQEIIRTIKAEYVEAGFMRSDVQTEMNRTQAVRPFSRCELGTLREKHNTVINIIRSVDQQQRHSDEVGEDEETGEDKEEYWPWNTNESPDKIEDNKDLNDCEEEKSFELSCDKHNSVMETLFIGSFYIGKGQSSQMREENHEESRGWRVRL